MKTWQIVAIGLWLGAVALFTIAAYPMVSREFEKCERVGGKIVLSSRLVGKVIASTARCEIPK